MEKSLTLLREQDGILDDWSDLCILPGQNITEQIRKRMEETDIFVFLVSPDFIASKPCREEWLRAIKIASERSSIFCVPVILSDCAWKDLEGMSKLLALPKDGNPIKNFSGQRKRRGKQVYEGLKGLMEQLRKTFTIKDDFRKEMETTEFLSQEQVSLQSIFVFPNLSFATTSEDEIEKTIRNENELLENDYILVHGERLSGKTALCRYLFLTLVDRSVPVLYVDLENNRSKGEHEGFLRSLSASI